jgi:hypothetical protein
MEIATYPNRVTPKGWEKSALAFAALDCKAGADFYNAPVAYHLNREHQPMLVWASCEYAPILPLQVHRGLTWRFAVLRRYLRVTQ